MQCMRPMFASSLLKVKSKFESLAFPPFGFLLTSASRAKQDPVHISDIYAGKMRCLCIGERFTGDFNARTSERKRPTMPKICSRQ